tara:strand:+ start:208 stop:438 length:231 start_codon:yes stop_codon:yes gene_type:complete
MNNATTPIGLKKIIQCREITREIINFGVNEEQIFRIIMLLALELETPGASQKIACTVRDYIPDVENLTNDKPSLQI